MIRWRIRHKLGAALILVIAITGVLSAGSFYGLSSYRRSNKLFNYHQKQLELLGYLDRAVSGLIFPSREELETTPESSRIRREKMLSRLELVSSMLDKYQQGLDDKLHVRVTRDGTLHQRSEIERMRGLIGELDASIRGAHPSAVANLPTSTPTHFWLPRNERDVVAKLILSLNRLRGVIHTEMTRYVDADRRHYLGSLAVVVSTTVLVLVMLVVLVWLGYRAIFHPIRELYQGVRKVAGANFDSRVQLDSGDEFQELGEAFNEMTDRLQETYKDLNRQVEERSRQLIRSERLASVGFLAAGVAHEINNPLASIAFCGEAVEGRLRQLLPADHPESEVVANYLSMIQQEAFRCKAITERLLDFSRAGEPERVDTDLVALVRNVIELVQHLGRVKEKVIDFKPSTPVWARVNPSELKQVLLNLVVNALESMDERGTVTIAIQRQPRDVTLSVTDEGCGMTDEVKQNLFEPFFTRQRSGKGTGLGLSISHLIISQHGGTLEAHSPGPNKGSTFTVRLPVESKGLLKKVA